MKHDLERCVQESPLNEMGKNQICIGIAQKTLNRQSGTNIYWNGLYGCKMTGEKKIFWV